MFDLCLENALIEKHLTVNIGISDGKIAEISKAPIKASERINVKGKLVLPGLIDSHVHFREPGLEYKEDFRTGSMAAAHGGFTTVLEMPNTRPETDTAREFENKVRIGEKKSVVDFGLHAGFSEISEVQKILVFEPASFKVFMDTSRISDLADLFRKLSELGSNVPVTLHCENMEIIKASMADMSHRRDPYAYSLARPPLAEEVAVAEAIALARHFNHRVHICHISTLKALEFKEKFSALVTCEVTPHHLILDSGYLKKFGTLAKTNPPLRSPTEGVSLDELDKIDVIGTDHAPHSLEEKMGGVWDAPPGVPNLEVVLKLLLSLLKDGKIGISDIRAMLAERPARIFGLNSKGYIREGMDADFVVVDRKASGKIRADEFYSKAHYTPFEGLRYTGEASMTIVRGNVVMADGEVFDNRGIYMGSKYN